MRVCAQCNCEIKTTKFVQCYFCNLEYHFSPCCSLSERTYDSMAVNRRADWRCHKCKGKERKSSTSSNNSYHVIIDDTPDTSQQQKQQREDDIDVGESSKRFKDSLSINDLHNNVCALQNEVKINSKQLTGIQTTLNIITNTLSTLTSQVEEICINNNEKEKQIQDMERRINDLEQQLLNKSIEIKNVPNDNAHPHDVVKAIANSLNVELNDSHISDSYILKKSQKVIIEFATLNKKREIMGKIKRHRMESKILTCDENDKKYIFVNDYLTQYKRHLLWLAKTKAKENNWKFIWVKNGNILAKKNEISNPINIQNISDIELLTAAI